MDKEYAKNLKGAAQFALDMWDFWKNNHAASTSRNADERANRFGELHAYSCMLNQMTGARPDDNRARVEEVIEAM